MNRTPLLQLLQAYQPTEPEEQRMWFETIEFVKQNPACFERSLPIGHITGSAWVVDETGQFVLLMHHRKLDRWFQPGGHADGEWNILQVAIKEAQEETGLESVEVVSDSIYDVDVHLIPANTKDPAHFHYDIRFLLRANKAIPLKINNESKNLVWVPLEDVASYNNSESIMRMARKQKLSTFFE
ncbi:NUDIX hydrolase [Runella sp. SP2]|uniref:NUDIX hydrolase n=1 Tax=Runella sp. SP2 TaxID=2268026 RepID=UPI000F0770EF|nr:NUDIX hydrolase [Runella sp. SP2]AYQ32290.1 NUDIX domain-containing protein [Runella sp. SP2]